MADTNEDLKRMVRGIVADLECRTEPTDDEPTMDAWEYLEDILDIEYIVSSKGEYLGARILVTFGGPNIWINTRMNQVEGYWWGDTCTLSYTDELGIDEVCSEFYECTKG